LDDTHVPANQRPSRDDYDRFIYLVNLARDLNYEQNEIVTSSPFLVEDVLFNAILYRADECLLELAKLAEESIEEIEKWMRALREAFQSRLWSESDALYLDYDLIRGATIRQNTIAGLIPLYAGLPSKDQAKLLVENHLLNRDEYAPDGQHTHYFTPTASKTNPYFDPVKYWRGPIWVNTNWLLFEGLRRYAEHRGLAERIRSDTLELLDRNTFYEYFDPDTGQGLGTKNFSWSAALALVLLDTEKPRSLPRLSQ
jgi:glycogen debranching enzyme